MPPRLVAALAAPPVLAGFAADVQQDFAVWRHKRYLPQPVLATGDGPIGAYRRWTRQFYPAVEPAGVPAPRGSRAASSRSRG